MAEEVRRGHLAMGRVSIWTQWLIIISGILLSPLFVLFMTGVIGRSLLRTLWRAVGASALAEMGARLRRSSASVTGGPDGLPTASVLNSHHPQCE
jgi:hypothetical protein